ncbi:hypothetical protein C8J57DRAFT_1226150 [Mycena rebaudengoi]|nr:hypothetical protein C8J57DRAFT_1226150 [Mycena rebaudengoi]
MLYNIKTAVLLAVICLMEATNVSAIVPCGRCAIERRAEDVAGSILGMCFELFQNGYELKPDRFTVSGYAGLLFNFFIASKDMDFLQRFAYFRKDTAKNTLSRPS